MKQKSTSGGMRMKQVVADVGTSVLGSSTRDVFMFLLAGLGVSVSGAEYVGGILLAIAGALIASKLQPEQDKRELWVVVVTAFMASHIAVWLVQGGIIPTGINPQLAMTVAGFFSRYLARAALRLGGLVETRADTVFDRLLDRFLPPRKAKDGDGEGGV